MADAEAVRVVPATFAHKAVAPDPAYEVDLTAHLKASQTPAELVALYSRFMAGLDPFDALMRRVLWRALARSLGNGVVVEPGVGFKHIETFEIGSGVFLGSGVFVQGRFDGRCVIGDGTWIGPHSYFDARNLVIGNDVGWGPGAKVLGSAHTGLPLELPVIKTDLEIAPVVIEDDADIGVNAVILPGVRVGRGSIVGAGSVVTKDIAPMSVAAGVPARVLRQRDAAS